MVAQLLPFFPHSSQHLGLAWSPEQLLPIQSFGPDAVPNIRSVAQPIKVIAGES